ncbi:MAG: hypothetical protein U0K19_02880, partial [Bifidobacteriaceae bacterium]|nr:hypothetical protein [Bifidobacteriaceae bacterium]
MAWKEGGEAAHLTNEVVLMSLRDDALEDNLLGSIEAGRDVPTRFLPQRAMNPNIAEQMVRQYRLDEAKPNQNLTTFCTTQMEPQAVRLMTEALNTNAIDKSEYPKTAAMEDDCCSMIGH